MNTNDKATLRISHHGESRIVETTNEDWNWVINQRGEVNPRHLALIVQAVNEHAALNAVAEAADNLLGEIAWRFERTPADTNEELALQKVESALAALARVRESGVKP